MAVPALVVAACTSVISDPPPQDSTGSTSAPVTTTTTTTPPRECHVEPTSVDPIDTGSLPTDALALSNEQFDCADDVVIVGVSDLNEISEAAQLAAALGGPLLFPHPGLSAELQRLDPQTIHTVGLVALSLPRGVEVLVHRRGEAAELAGSALGVEEEVPTPAAPDTTTIVETVNAIADADRIAVPAPSTSTTDPSTDSGVEPSLLIEGLAVERESSSAWMVPAASPGHALLAAAYGSAVGASVVAIDADGLLSHPNITAALAGKSAETIRFVGTAPQVDPWHLAILFNGEQLPGGGFSVFPDDTPRRYVAFYGHPETTALGVLGEQGPEETLTRMGDLLAAYEGDGSQVVPVFEMIASVAAASATDDGDYSFEWPISAFEAWIETAAANEVYVIFDLQSGRDDFLTQAKQYEELLKLPFVGLALDPEWRLGPDQVHLKQVGRVQAAEVNQVIHWLADLVRDNGLPQKMLIVHQFRTFMIQDRHLLEERPELQVVIQMDGDGTEAQKDNTYAALNAGAEDAFWAWGWKNFFDEDEPGPPTPESTMGKDPTPVYVSYQ